MNFIRHHYKLTKKFYHENLRIIFPITILLFVVSITIFSIYASKNAGIATRLLLRLNPQITASINSMGLLPTIMKNLFTGFYLIALGCIPFLFISAFFVVYNGSLIGIMLGSTTITNMTTGMILTYLIPHGLFLIPAMLISAACGIYFCKRMIQHFMHIQYIESFYELFQEFVRIYLLIILPLMILSSIMEVLITPLFIALF